MTPAARRGEPYRRFVVERRVGRNRSGRVGDRHTVDAQHRGADQRRVRGGDDGEVATELVEVDRVQVESGLTEVHAGVAVDLGSEPHDLRTSVDVVELRKMLGRRGQRCVELGLGLAPERVRMDPANAITERLHVLGPTTHRTVGHNRRGRQRPTRERRHRCRRECRLRRRNDRGLRGRTACLRRTSAHDGESNGDGADSAS